MKKYLIGLVLIASNVYAGMPVEVYLRDKNTDGVGWYLAGLGNGFAFSNTRLKSLGEKPLYCPPTNFIISIPEMKRLIDLKASDYSPRDAADLWIEPMLLAELRASYPCK